MFVDVVDHGPLLLESALDWKASPIRKPKAAESNIQKVRRQLILRSCNFLRGVLFVDQAVHGGPGDTVGSCDLAQALAVLAIAEDRFTI
jgi:hypothetical protein